MVVIFVSTRYFRETPEPFQRILRSWQLSATPGAGRVWDTSNLRTIRSLKIAALPARPHSDPATFPDAWDNCESLGWCDESQLRHIMLHQRTSPLTN